MNKQPYFCLNVLSLRQQIKYLLLSTEKVKKYYPAAEKKKNEQVIKKVLRTRCVSVSVYLPPKKV